MKEAMKDLIQRLKSNRFCVENLMQSQRTGNYEKQEKIANKWLVLNEACPACTNLESSLRFGGKFWLLENPLSERGFRDLAMSMVMSAPLGYYRLICIFKAAPQIATDGYKQLLAFPLQHRNTESYLEFTDYKGGFGIAAHFTDASQLPMEYKQDLLELLNFLTSNEVAHPYDKTVAGSVA